jgi:hypothetical protein
MGPLVDGVGPERCGRQQIGAQGHKDDQPHQRVAALLCRESPPPDHRCAGSHERFIDLTRSKCFIRFCQACAVNSDVNSSASVNVSWTGATMRRRIRRTSSG